MNNESKSTPGNADHVQGEGDYEAAGRYDESVEKFAHSGKVDEAARAAKPESQQEAADLEQAERDGASHSKGEDRDIQSGSGKS